MFGYKYQLYYKMVKVRIKTTNAKTTPFEIGKAIGTASWGPVNSIREFRNYADVLSTFVSGNVVLCAKDFFNHEGSAFRILRVGDSNLVKATEVLLYDIGVSDTTVLTATALYYGTHGNSIDVTVTEVDGTHRSIVVTDGVTTETYNNGGIGYTTNQAIADAINGTSNLITLTVASGKETIELVDGGPQAIDLSTGADGKDGSADVDPIFIMAKKFE